MACPAWAKLDYHPARIVCLPDGRKLQYAEYGIPDGKLVLYFHGTPGSHLEVGLLDEELEESKIRLISIDRPGIGCSTYQPCRRITDWPADVACLLNAIGFDSHAQFGVIAMSGGAPYGLAVARAMPHRVSHLALVSGHTPPGVCVERGNSDDAIEFIRRHPRIARLGLRIARRQLCRRPDQVVRLVMNSWSASDRRLIYCNSLLYKRLVNNLRMAVKCGPEGVVQDVGLLGSCWGFRVAEAAGVPISIWQGGCDEIVTPSMARWFHSQLPGSELHFDPRAGHVTMFKWHGKEIFANF